jgi:FAD dependent oxidoreductase TIGR03364
MVLREFESEAHRSSFGCEIIDPREAVRRCQYIRQDGLRLALWSPNEACVDPRATSTALVEMLRDVMEVTFETETLVTCCEPPHVSSGSRVWDVERAWICAGDELQALFGQHLRELGLVRCKLQMMRSRPIPTRIGPMLAAGLTLLHYAAFRRCPTLASLHHRLAAERPDHLRNGIHVMVAQNGLGELTIGDSHQYGDDITPFDTASIEALILEYLNTFFDASTLHVQSRWHGRYVKHPSQPYAVLTPADNVVAIAGLGGHGMTLSFGLAEEVVARTLDPRNGRSVASLNGSTVSSL